jgi:hypothetical protein
VGAAVTARRHQGPGARAAAGGRKRILALAFAAVLLVVPAHAASAEEAPVPLARLRLPTIDGASTIDLSTLRGKKLLLIEFASW